VPGTASASQVGKRLVFVVDAASNGIEALEQAYKGAGWTTGRGVAMKRLFEQDPKLDYLTDEDRRVLKTIRKQAGWYAYHDYGFDRYASPLALIGHPNVFDSRNRDRRVELFAYPAELVVSETPKGYSFALSHSASQPTVFIEEETPTRWRVIEVSQKLVELHATLGKDGLIVPIDARACCRASARRQLGAADPLGACRRRNRGCRGCNNAGPSD
jgi:hypothetical protein